MRILGLHGAGTSADIFETQTSMLRANLDISTYHFDFIDAPYPWHAGPGVASFYPKPYFAWWEKATAADIKAATQRLLDVLSACPPYDAVLCFSQGCNILSSLILLHQSQYPDRALPFRGAIFICGGVPLPILETLIPVSAAAKRQAASAVEALHAASAAAPQKVETFLSSGARQRIWDRPTGLWDGQTEGVVPSWGMPDVDAADVWGIDLSSRPAPLRIDIPTVHIFGHKDPVCIMSLQLALMCNEGTRLIYDHAGGHEVPFNSVVSRDIAAAVRWLEERLP
jgi:predicted esterase